jgi:predicted ATPase/class 3 adenylate cyclase
MPLHGRSPANALRMTDSTILTFLFTDIEGSTSKWEEQPELMAQAVARHDALLRDAIGAHRGTIVKTTGDGIYAAFVSPQDCLAAVIDVQLALLDPAATAGMALAIRCGMHTGAVQARDNDYFGSTINRTARIMGAAHGGQVLVSNAVADLLRDCLPAGVSLKDLGHVHLKGLATPEAVYQIVHPKLYQNFPPLRELEATPNNLPQQLTTFIGRDRERQEIEGYLATTRLLTLLGMGGLGKTRLALQIGAGVMDAYPDGVWFVDLQTIRDSPLVAGETARVLGVREEAGRPLLQTLCAHLKSRKLLLILDNCEQIVDASAELSAAILRAAPDVRILTTSRTALRVPGEQTYLVQPLPLPSKSGGFEALSESTAVQLFVERAKLHKPGFALTEREAPAIAELVARLEGIPLALELAAARVRSLSLTEINRRLQDRYKLLVSGDRTLQARQQTLRALVDWSYDLLQEHEQVLLARIAVFAGSFDLAAAEAICGVAPLSPDDILDLITSLVEKSLINMEEGDEGARYRVLETIRDYAREKLVLRQEQAKLCAVHCDYFFVMAKAANRGLQGADQGEWTRRVEMEHDNLRAAITGALEGRSDPILSVKLVVALMGFWMLRGYSTEGRRYVRASLELPAVQSSDFLHGHALYVGATLAYSQSDYKEALEMLERCLAIRRIDAKQLEIAATLSTMSLVRLSMGDADLAFEAETESVEIFRRVGNETGEVIGRFHLGQIHAHRGDEARARSEFEHCLTVARTLDNQELECESQLMLGELALEEGTLESARERFTASLEIAQTAGDRRGEASALWRLGRVDCLRSDSTAARIRLSGALRAFQTFEMFAELLGCLEDYAALAQAVGSKRSSVRIHASAQLGRERLALPRTPKVERRWREAVAQLRHDLGDAEFDKEWSAGQSWELGDTVRWALTWEFESPVAAVF